MRSHFEIVRGDAEQPWFARLFADNGLEVWRTSENYVLAHDAERAVCILAEALYLGRSHLEAVPATRPGEPLQAQIVVDLAGATARLGVPVLYLDEREEVDADG